MFTGTTAAFGRAPGAGEAGTGEATPAAGATGGHHDAGRTADESTRLRTVAGRCFGLDADDVTAAGHKPGASSRYERRCWYQAGG